MDVTPYFRRLLDRGSVVQRFETEEEIKTYRSELRKAARAAGIRIQTGVASQDPSAVWAVNPDHEPTEIQEQASRIAMNAMWSANPIHYDDAIEMARRKAIRPID